MNHSGSARLAWARLLLLPALAAGLLSAIIGCNTKPASSEKAPNPAGSSAPARPLAESLTGLTVPAVALSPDGAHLAFVAARAGSRQQLYLRSVQQTESMPIPGTEGAETPFFSPDGQWIAFFAGGKLKKAPVNGGTVLTLCDASQGRGASWGSDDTIVFTPNLSSGLFQVSSSGGTPKPLTALQEERSHRWPELLPGGKAVLFTIAKGGSWDDGQIVVQQIETGERRVLVEGGTYPRYAPTGHLVYVRAGALVAVPFDLARLQLTGTAAPITAGVLMEARDGAAQYSFSRDGTLVYVPSNLGSSERRLVWVNRDGSAAPLGAPPRAYEHPRLSPDGQRVAVSIAGASPNIFLYDIPGNRLTQITSEATNTFPVWTPDGKRLAFRSTKAGPWNVFWKPADGAGAAEQLTMSKYLNEASSWSPDGQLLAFTELHPTTRRDLWVLSLKGERKPRLFLRTPADESAARFSPDGRWLAYASDASGRSEIYVQPFPATGGPTPKGSGTQGDKWQISTGGGREPVWAPSGVEIFYRDGNKMMAADVKTQPSFASSKPRLLFEGHFETALASRANYDVAPDGQRFLMLQAGEQQDTSDQIKVVPNWFEEFKRRIPSKSN